MTVSGSWFRRYPPYRWRLDNHPRFPDVCAQAGNGFVGQENCFVAGPRRNNLGEKFNDLSHMTQASSACPEHGSGSRAPRGLSFVGPVVQWTSRGRSLAHHRQRPAASNQVQLLTLSGVMTHLQRRVAVVGNGITDVGNQTASRNPSQPIAERLAGVDGPSEPPIDKPLQPGTISICGAMSLQGGDSGRGCAPVFR